MKKVNKKVLLASTTVAALALTGGAANAATTDVPISAVVLAPVQITQTRTMMFGSMTVATGSSGTLTVTNLDGTSATGGVTIVGSNAQAGGFTLKGSTGVNIDVSAPASVQITHTVTNTIKMTVDQFKINAAAGTINATPFVRSLAAATETGFRLGGRLTASAAQAAGTYTGSVTLTANYQ